MRALAPRARFQPVPGLHTPSSSRLAAHLDLAEFFSWLIFMQVIKIIKKDARRTRAMKQAAGRAGYFPLVVKPCNNTPQWPTNDFWCGWGPYAASGVVPNPEFPIISHFITLNRRPEDGTRASWTRDGSCSVRSSQSWRLGRPSTASCISLGILRMARRLGAELLSLSYLFLASRPLLYPLLIFVPPPSHPLCAHLSLAFADKQATCKKRIVVTFELFK